MNWDRPSLEHFRHLRSLPFTHLESGLDYNIQHEGDVLYVVFAETNAIKFDRDWSDDLNFFPEPFAIYDKVKAHGGIARQYLSIRQTLMDYFYSGAYKQVYVSGYSLGGALTVAAVQDIGYHIDRDGLDVKIFGISYDGPRFFCSSEMRERAVKNRLLLVKTHWDPVVHVPFKFMVKIWTIKFDPFGFVFSGPNKWISFWADYGEVKWIGKPWRLLPLQHMPDQVERALIEEYEQSKY